MTTSVLKMGSGELGVYAPTYKLTEETKLDLDAWDDGKFSLWFGSPLAARLDMDRAAMERLYSFLGGVLHELDLASADPGLDKPREREAICE